jgi:ribonucleotide monophosphatase NagD (HAD superfamily)
MGQMLALTRAVHGGKGVLYLYGNYGGDNLNFDMACEAVELDDIKTATVRVADDVATACIGDSAEHDVAGGHNAGFSTLLVLQGVSAGHDPATLSPQPDYVMDAFQW